MIKAAMFDTKSYDMETFSLIAAKNNLQIKMFDTKLNEDTVSLAKGYDCVIVFVNDNITDFVINKLYEYGIKLIALRCAGFNNVNVKAAYKKIHIVRVPSYSPQAVAEHTMAMLLTSIRRIHKAYNRTKDFNFSLSGLVGFNLNGKTVGIIGTGKIGRSFINICKGFGMNVIAYDVFPDKNADIKYVPLEDLLKQSDIISLHCPLTKETQYLINKDTIKIMKKGVVIINTSRGALIESEALLDSIKQKKVGAACLDVYEEESDLFFEDFSGHIVQDDIIARLITMPNVLITSHQAFLTSEALHNIASTTITNIVDFFTKGKTLNEICYICERVGECRKKREEKCF